MRIRAAVASAALLLFCGCSSGPSSTMRRDLNHLLATQDYDKALALVDQKKESEYGKKNAVLYYLDRGNLLHDAGRYTESDESLDKAENRITELYTVSLSQAAGTLLINDTTMDYAGEPFERALMNVLRALNYVFLGKTEDALVESRKVEAFLDELNRHLKDRNLYKDDAFARYLDSLLYADLGNKDDARISKEASDAAYAWYLTEYKTPPPDFGLSIDPPKNDGELVFIHFNGTAPHKVQKTYQLTWTRVVQMIKEEHDESLKTQFDRALRALLTNSAMAITEPEYTQDPYRIATSQLIVDGKLGAKTLLVEDVSAIAAKTFQDHLAMIRLRAIARAAAKYLLVGSATNTCRLQKYGNGDLNGFLCKLVNAVSSTTEIADTRAWATLPSQIRMARLPLPPGQHDIQINFLDVQGAVVTSYYFKNVLIQRGKRTYLHYRTAI